MVTYELLSHNQYGFRKIIELCLISLKHLCSMLFGMHLVSSGSVFPFSLDLPDFCRNFCMGSNTIIKIYISHDVFLINEVHIGVRRNRLFEKLTTFWIKIGFLTQSRLNYMPCIIIGRFLGFVVVVDRFMQKEKLFISNKVKHWILFVSRYWWEISPVVVYVGDWKKRVVVAENYF